MIGYGGSESKERLLESVMPRFMGPSQQELFVFPDRSVRLRFLYHS